MRHRYSQRPASLFAPLSPLDQIRLILVLIFTPYKFQGVVR